MNVVLYTGDFEPITILDLPMWALDRMAVGERIQLPVPMVMEVAPFEQSSAVEAFNLRTVQIWSEPLIRKGIRKQVLFTDDDIGALELESGWLPGQQKMVNGYRDTAKALSRLLLIALGGGS